MEKVEQAICIYMICLSVKISISYFAWKALNRNPTAYLPHIRGIREGALIVEEPHQTQWGQHGVVGAPFPTLSLLHCCSIVSRGIGNKCLLVGYLFPIAFTVLELPQGPLYMSGWWRSMTTFPLTNSPPRFLLSVQLQPVLGQWTKCLCLLSTSAFEDGHLNVGSMYFQVGRCLLENKKSTSILKNGEPTPVIPLKHP